MLLRFLITLILILGLIAVSFSFFSCKNDSVETVEIFLPGEQLFGTMTASKKSANSNTGIWEASGWATFETWGLLVISGSTYSEEGFRRENLLLNNIPIKVGSFVLADGFISNINIANAVYSRMEGDGDAIGADYFPKGPHNVVEITEIDTIAKQIKGHFNIQFEIAPNWKASGYPNEVWFESGVFDIHYE